jgi:glycerophosphoryl diester phosphodiesterase
MFKKYHNIIIIVINSLTSLHCNTMQQQKLDLQGHRGCRGLMPENTIPAMLKALELGVTTLEMDCAITKDGQLILSHEPFFNHEITTLPNGQYITEATEKQYNIYQLTYDSVKTFDVGLKPHPRFAKQQKIAACKPLLSAVIDSVKQYCTTHNKPLPYFNIEIKSLPEGDNVYHPTVDVFCKKVMDIIEQHSLARNTIIQSFDVRALQYMHKAYSSIVLAALIEEKISLHVDNIVTQLGFTPAIISPHYALVDTAFIKACHNKNIKIIPWTVNDKPTMEKLIKEGVDGIITDYPDQLITVTNH